MRWTGRGTGKQVGGEPQQIGKDGKGGVVGTGIRLGFCPTTGLARLSGTDLASWDTRQAADALTDMLAR